MTQAQQVHYLDVRGLEAPEPLERVLEALDKLAPADQLSMRIDREPHPLYRILANNGYRHHTTALPDFTYDVRIWRDRGPQG